MQACAARRPARHQGALVDFERGRLVGRVRAARTARQCDENPTPAELHGSEGWTGLIPRYGGRGALDPQLRKLITSYGECCQAAYQGFIKDVGSLRFGQHLWPTAPDLLDSALFHTSDKNDVARYLWGPHGATYKSPARMRGIFEETDEAYHNCWREEAHQTDDKKRRILDDPRLQLSETLLFGTAAAALRSGRTQQQNLQKLPDEDHPLFIFGSHGAYDRSAKAGILTFQGAKDRRNWVGFVSVARIEAPSGGHDPGDLEIIVTLRGTILDGEWKGNIVMNRLTPFDQCVHESWKRWIPYFPWFLRKGRVHSGFWSAYFKPTTEKSPEEEEENTNYSPSEKVWNAVKKLLHYPGLRDRVKIVTTTGHSLGGAIATLAAADLAKRINDEKSLQSKPVVRAVTFASPRVGDRSFRHHLLTNLNVKVLRVANVRDMVPEVPGIGWSAFQRFLALLWGPVQATRLPALLFGPYGQATFGWALSAVGNLCLESLSMLVDILPLLSLWNYRHVASSTLVLDSRKVHYSIKPDAEPTVPETIWSWIKSRVSDILFAIFTPYASPVPGGCLKYLGFIGDYGDKHNMEVYLHMIDTLYRDPKDGADAPWDDGSSLLAGATCDTFRGRRPAPLINISSSAVSPEYLAKVVIRPVPGQWWVPWKARCFALLRPVTVPPEIPFVKDKNGEYL